jgi:hypothetical protein
MIKRAALTWAAMIPVAIGNGIFRESVTRPVVGVLPAHQISVVTGSLGFLGVTWLMFRHQAVKESDQTLLKVGLAWVAGTIAFEFGFGYLVAGKTWSELFHDYNIARGRLWPLVLLVIFLAPLAVKHLAGRNTNLQLVPTQNREG